MRILLALLLSGCAYADTACKVIDVADTACTVFRYTDEQGVHHEVRVTPQEVRGFARSIEAKHDGGAP